MERTERFYLMDMLLQGRTPVPRRVFLDKLEISPATFKRDVEYMRDRLGMPVMYNKEYSGYCYDPKAPRKPLPGLWFSAAEAYALIAMQELIRQLEPGLLAPKLSPLMERLEKLLDSDTYSNEQVLRRVRILRMSAREQDVPCFSIAARAVLDRRRMEIVYYSRGKDETTRRQISPQRLTHYRDNWYLDAWCHLRKDIRSFAVDAIREAHLLEERAQNVKDNELDRVLASSYGIFSGEATQVAKLRFTAERARWVSRETWHPQQVGTFDREGRYSLEFPFNDDRELLMDILKHGGEVEVLAPAALRGRVREELSNGARQYI